MHLSKKCCAVCIAVCLVCGLGLFLAAKVQKKNLEESKGQYWVEKERVENEQELLQKTINKGEYALQKGIVLDNQQYADALLKQLQIAKTDVGTISDTDLSDAQLNDIQIIHQKTEELERVTLNEIIGDLQTALDEYKNAQNLVIQEVAVNGTEEKEYAKIDIEDGLYESSEAGSYKEGYSDGISTAYKITVEGQTIVIYGSMRYMPHFNDWNTYEERPLGVYRFPISETTTYGFFGGGLEEYASREEFVRIAQHDMDRNNGLGLFVAVKNGIATGFSLSS